MRAPTVSSPRALPLVALVAALVLATGPISCAAPTEGDDAEATSDALTASPPIAISGDAELARAASRGAGTEADPYVLSGKKVVGRFSFATGADVDACFAIENTTKPFVLKDSACEYAHVGVKLTNVQHATVRRVAISKIVGVFGWASRGGAGEDGRGVQVARSGDVTLDGVTIEDVYGGFGMFGVPFGPSAQDGRSGGRAVGIETSESSHVTVSKARVTNMWGGAGGAGAVGIFVGDPNGVGGRGGLGGMAVGMSFEGGSDVTVVGSRVQGIRAGAGAAAAVSNVLFFGGNGGDAGDGNHALGVVAKGTARIAVQESEISELWASAGGAGAIGGVGAIGGRGGAGGRGGTAAAIIVERASDVRITNNVMSTIRGAAGGAGAAGVVGFLGGAGGSGGDGGWAVGFLVDHCTSIASRGNEVSTAWGAAGAAGGAGAIGAWFIEAQGGKGGDGGWAIGSQFLRSERVDEAQSRFSGEMAGLGGLGGGIQLVTMGAAGKPGRTGASITQR